MPFGVSGDGRTGYASAWTPSFSGVAAVDLQTGALHRIMRFASPGTDQADGAWGGRWLAWEQTYSLQSLDRFTVYAWDSTTGVERRLGGSLASRSGMPWPSPWHAPAVSGDFAAWAQGYGPGGLVQIRLADLATGQVRVVARGHDQAPFFDGDLLVWPESDRPGALDYVARIRACGWVTALPAVLRPVAGTGLRGHRRHPNGVPQFRAQRAVLLTGPRPGRARSAATPAGTEFSALAMGKGVLAWTTTKRRMSRAPKPGERSRSRRPTDWRQPARDRRSSSRMRRPAGRRIRACRYMSSRRSIRGSGQSPARGDDPPVPPQGR